MYLTPEWIGKLDRAKVRAYLEEKFSIDAVAKKYIGLYQEMLLEAEQ